MLDGMDQNKTRVPHFSQTTKVKRNLNNDNNYDNNTNVTTNISFTELVCSL